MSEDFREGQAAFLREAPAALEGALKVSALRYGY
jgi:hypothetical protein